MDRVGMGMRGGAKKENGGSYNEERHTANTRRLRNTSIYKENRGGAMSSWVELTGVEKKKNKRWGGNISRCGRGDHLVAGGEAVLKRRLCQGVALLRGEPVSGLLGGRSKDACQVEGGHIRRTFILKIWGRCAVLYE